MHAFPQTVDGTWGQWASWGVCSATCEGGTKHRIRTCEYTPTNAPKGKPCQGHTSDITQCVTSSCPGKC